MLRTLRGGLAITDDDGWVAGLVEQEPLKVRQDHYPVDCVLADPRLLKRDRCCAVVEKHAAGQDEADPSLRGDMLDRLPHESRRDLLVRQRLIVQRAPLARGGFLGGGTPQGGFPTTSVTSVGNGMLSVK